MMRAVLVLVLAAAIAASGCLRKAPAPERPNTTPPPVALPAAPAAPEPGPAPALPAKPVDAEDNSWYQPRSAWTTSAVAQDATEPMARPYRITVHHSGEPGDAKAEPKELMRTFERNHKQRGWASIGYHFLITRDGRVFEGRPLRYQGAHAGGDNNIGNVGVCLIGDYEHSQVPKAQREALIDVLDRLTQRYKLSRSSVYGHRNFKTTDCPGRYLMRVVEDFRAGK